MSARATNTPSLLANACVDVQRDFNSMRASPATLRLSDAIAPSHARLVSNCAVRAWLLGDINGYCKFSQTFDMCLESRNAAHYVAAVKQQVAKLPWSAQALGTTSHLTVSPHIKTVFAKVSGFASESDQTEKRNHQFKHLLAMADHEQRVVLQPRIYEDKDFGYWLAMQRSAWVRGASPDLEPVFCSACRTDDKERKSAAPDDTNLEAVRSRMKWITAAADLFHRLMGEHREYMEKELGTIAGWSTWADR